MTFEEIIAWIIIAGVLLAVLTALISLIRAPKGNKRRSSGEVRTSSAFPPPPQPSNPPSKPMSDPASHIISAPAAAFRSLKPKAPSSTNPEPLTATGAEYERAAEERMGTPPTSPPILRLGEEGKALPINVHAGSQHASADMGCEHPPIPGKKLLTEHGQPIVYERATFKGSPARLSLTIDQGIAKLTGSGIGVADFQVEEKEGTVDVVLTMSLKRGVLALLAMMAFLLQSCTIGISPTGDKNVSVDGVQLYSVVKSVLADRAARAAAEHDAKAAKNVQPEG